MGWIGCVHCEKFWCDFVAKTFALIAPVHTVLHRPSHGNEKSKCTRTLRNAPIHVFRIQWGWIGCVCCKKFRCDFMAQTYALVAPVQPVLHRVSCSNEILPNASKYYETHQNMSLGSNGVDRVRSLRKFRCDFVARTFALIAPVQFVLALSFV